MIILSNLFHGYKEQELQLYLEPFYTVFGAARRPQDTGAPNNRMFPNTPEVSQMVFSML